MASTKKLTKKELEELQKHVLGEQEVVKKKASLCLEKETKMRQINQEFDEQWELLGLHEKNSRNQTQNFVEKLNKKYGKEVSFNIETGEINKLK